jgi:hypothetical protein
MAGTPITAITRPMRAGPAAWARIVWISGRIMPPPIPCTTRKTIRLAADQASPQSIEPAMKIVIEAIHIGLAPKRSTAQPVNGITMASASR